MIRYLQFISAAGGGGSGGLRWFEAEDTSPGGVVTSGPSDELALFLDELTVSGSEGFEGSFTLGGEEYTFENGLSMEGVEVVVNGTTATFGSTGAVASTSTASGRFNTTSGGSIYIQAGGALTMLSITFDAPISAFGSYLTDVGDFSGQVSIVLYKSGGGTVTHDIDHTVNGSSGSLMFVGFVDDVDEYTQIDYIASSTLEGIGFDDMYIATQAQLA